MWQSRSGLSLLLARRVQLAREQLSELELPHLYKAAARGSPKRQQLLDARGAFQVPHSRFNPKTPNPRFNLPPDVQVVLSYL